MFRNEKVDRRTSKHKGADMVKRKRFSFVENVYLAHTYTHTYTHTCKGNKKMLVNIYT
jgi:hypothetical protein